ncbi:MAG: hypothetical protein ABEJ88_07590 [Halobacterium sp.]
MRTLESLVAVTLYAVAFGCLVVGVPALLAPDTVRARVPGDYVAAVGERREWRGFGAGLTSIGISLALIANGVAA